MAKELVLLLRLVGLIDLVTVVEEWFSRSVCMREV